MTNNTPISIVCACMNRANALKGCIGSWLIDQRIQEILIVDWSSTPKLELDITDTRIKIIRVEGKKQFNLGQAYNTGFKAAKFSKIMKMDVDYFINPYYDLLGEVPVPESTFYTGNWKLHQYDGDMGFLRYTNGWLYVDKNDFWSAGGYREDLQGYGFDDSDLYQRLCNHGFTHKTLNLQVKPLLFHVPHDHMVRVENYEKKNIVDSERHNMQLCIKPQSQS